MWIEESFFKYISAIILVLLATLLLYYNLPVFYLILWFLAAIFLPILFSTLLYYLIRPAIIKLETWLPRFVAILLVYILIIFVFTFLGLFLVNEFVEAIGHYSQINFDAIKERFIRIFADLKDYVPLPNFSAIQDLFIENLPKINNFVYSLIVGFLTAITSIVIALALTPFILFYFLRDDILFSRFVLRYTPQKYQEEVQKIIKDVDVTLSGFIMTQATVAVIIGSFLFLGYLLIGLPYALSLAIFAMIFYIIPFLGTFIAIIPALIVAGSIHFSMIIKVVIVMMIAHFIETYLITPRLMSNTLKIHPLTIILLLLIGGSLFGILGLMLITPAYAILKVLVWNIYKIFRLRYEMAQLQQIAEERETRPEA